MLFLLFKSPWLINKARSIHCWCPTHRRKAAQGDSSNSWQQGILPRVGAWRRQLLCWSWQAGQSSRVGQSQTTPSRWFGDMVLCATTCTPALYHHISSLQNTEEATYSSAHFTDKDTEVTKVKHNLPRIPQFLMVTLAFDLWDGRSHAPNHHAALSGNHRNWAEGPKEGYQSNQMTQHPPQATSTTLNTYEVIWEDFKGVWSRQWKEVEKYKLGLLF